MNGKPIGGLRHRLVIEKRERTPDGGGGVSEAWLTVAHAWGAIEPRGGGEGVEAGRLAGRHAYDITIRYRGDVEPMMRFRSGARIFHVLSVTDVDERKRWLGLLCEERDL